MENQTSINLTEALKADTLLNKLKFALKLKNDIALANELGVSKATLSGWRKRDALDFKKVIELAGKHNINVQWWLFNQGNDMFYKDTEQTVDPNESNNLINKFAQFLDHIKTSESAKNKALDLIKETKQTPKNDQA